MYLVELYVTNSSLNVNYPFTYLSNEYIDKYKRVKIYFSSSLSIGLVVECSRTDKSKEELEKEFGYKLSNIIEVIDDNPVIDDELFDLALWLSKTTISPLISCLNTMLPNALKTTRNHKNAKTVKKIKINDIDIRLTAKQQDILNNLRDGMTYSDALKLSNSIIKKLIEYNCISVYEDESKYIASTADIQSFKTLTKDQNTVFNNIIESDKRVSLLFGVTGSGKTEVYLHLARHYLNQGKQVLILVPEISLTPQMIERVRERFSDVIFYHSELSDQERYEQYQRVKEGEVKIVVGTRSSIFLPFSNLGIIIVDEEHDSSYKQDNVPCYHVKNVALKRAITQDSKLLLASATPSLDSYTRALKGDYNLLVLNNRINLSLPEIEVVDLNDEIKNRHSYILSSKLISNISDTLNNNKQAIILLNRRGYSTIVKCSECGTTLMCNDCDIPLNYHNDENVLKCHQCSRTYKVPSLCPNCHADSLIYYGFGTKKVEEEIRSLFPDANIERMDRDNVTKKGSHKNILDRFGKHETDILIGTQMIAKGLDYPDVTLVGILNADAGLMHQDYNASKVTFDLLMQASGRSGRSSYPGKVIIQAFNVDHYVIKSVINQDYGYFYKIEMNYRHKALYPPYTHIVELLLSDINENRLTASSSDLYDKIVDLPYKIYKPVKLNRLQKLNRCRILVMDKDLNKMLKDLTIYINEYINERNHSRIKVDIDPLYLE